MRRLALAVLAVAACDNRLEARVGKAILPQATGHEARPPGRPVVVLPGEPPATPTAGAVLAIDVNVPWAQVRAAVTASPPPGLLVGDFARIRGFHLEDPLGPGPSIRLTATPGKFCVAPPGSDLAYCTEAGDHRHISAAFVREVVAKAVAEYDLHQVVVDAAPDLLWADLVRAVDGARTCCRQPVPVALRR